MGISSKDLEAKLIEKLTAIHVEVKDVSDGCGQAFEVLIVSEVFEGLPLIKRHKLVNEAIKEEIKDIHAFSQKTITPTQWKELKEKS